MNPQICLCLATPPQQLLSQSGQQQLKETREEEKPHA